MHRLVGAIGTALLGMLAAACAAGGAAPPPRVLATPRPSAPAQARFATPPPLAPAPRDEPPALALTATSAPASIPIGWVRGAGAATLDPPSPLAPSSLEALAQRRSPPRLAVAAPMILRIAELPVIEVGPRVDWSKEPIAPPSTDHAEDLIFDWFGTRGRDAALAAAGSDGVGAGVSVRGQRFGFLDLNFYSSFTIPGRAGGLVASCASLGGTGYRSASWLSLSLASSAGVRVEGAEAWFDYHACKPYVMRRIQGEATTLPGGLGYAFRTRCSRCEVPTDELHVLLPEIGWSNDNRQDGFRTERSGAPLSHLYLTLGPGAAGSILGHFTAFVIDRWRTLGAPIAQRRGAIVGVEVSHAASEAEPTALVYVMDAPPE